MDGTILVLVILFAIRGWGRGTIGQVFSLIGVAVGLWVGAWLAQWVGQQWLGARPAVVFTVLRWLVAGLGGLAAVSLFHWTGQKIREAVHGSPAAWVDRAGGIAVGAGFGAAVAAVLLVMALLVPVPHGVSAVAARARMASPIAHGAVRACALGDRFVPGTRWLGKAFEAAERRTTRAPRRS